MDSQPRDPLLEALLARASEGDADAWRVLVERYSPRVFALMVRQCGDRDLAEEITQDTFVKIVTKISQYTETGRFESWLFRIATNRLRDEMRRRKRQARPMDMGPGSLGNAAGESAWAAAQGQVIMRSPHQPDDPLDALDKQEQLERLQEAVNQMTDADREILHLRHTAGLSFPQIAEALDQPLGTVLARGHRALGKLRKILEQQEA